MIKSVSFTVFAIFVVLGISAPKGALSNERCDLGRCFSGLSEAEQKRVLSGETVLDTKVDASSGFEQLYGYKLVRGVTPDLALAVFSDFSAHVKELGIVRRANVIDQGPGRVTVDYELKAGDIVGGMAKLAPSSEYVLNENIYHDKESGRFWVTWEIDGARTAKYYKGFSITGHIGQPEYIHGYFVIEPVAGTADVIISYANVAVLKNEKAKKMARDRDGMVAKNARAAHAETLERFARWIERVGTESDAVKAAYIQKLGGLQPICQRYLK